MRQSIRHFFALCLIASICITSTGCLVIGGKETTYKCEGNHKATEAELAQVRQRLAILEQYAGITPPQQNLDPAAQPISVASAVSEIPAPQPAPIR